MIQRMLRCLTYSFVLHPHSHNSKVINIYITQIWVYHVHGSHVAKWGGIYKNLNLCKNPMMGFVLLTPHLEKWTNYFKSKSSQDYLCCIKTDFLHAYKDIQTKSATTSMRQAAEWWMQAFQSSFPPVKDWFVYKRREERQSILKILLHLYNLHANIVGINQIQNYYMLNSEPCGSALIHNYLIK